MPINELGKPGVPDVTDVFMGLPPAINGGQQMLQLADQRQPSNSVLAPPGKRRVTVLEDKQLDFPCLCLNIYVEGDANEQKMFASMFVRALCRKAETLDQADLVVFTGGTDVDPALYGHQPHHTTDDPDKERDKREIKLFYECKKRGIPMLGICRGAQFLHVMHGGKLYQDVDNHNRAHPIVTVPEGEIIAAASSVHHQMIYPDAKLGIRILATSSIANRRIMWEKGTVFSNTIEKRSDVEAFFYRDTCSLGFQGHPEYSSYPEYTQWCMQMIEDWINANPDCEWTKTEEYGARYRLKKEFIGERDKMEKSIMAQAEKKGKPVLTVPKASAASNKKESK